MFLLNDIPGGQGSEPLGATMLFHTCQPQECRMVSARMRLVAFVVRTLSCLQYEARGDAVQEQRNRDVYHHILVNKRLALRLELQRTSLHRGPRRHSLATKSPSLTMRKST